MIFTNKLNWSKHFLYQKLAEPFDGKKYFCNISFTKAAYHTTKEVMEAEKWTKDKNIIVKDKYILKNVTELEPWCTWMQYMWLAAIKGES